MQAVELIVAPRWTLPMGGQPVREQWGLAVEADRIVDVGPLSRLDRAYAPRRRLERPHHALLPGFVNAHTHAAMTLLRGLPVRGPLMQWLNETIWPAERRCVSAQFVKDGTTLAIAEMLRAGITCFADMYYFPDEVARLARAHGLRVSLGLPISEARTAWAQGSAEHLEKAEALWDEYRGDPLVTPVFAPHSPYAVERETLLRLRRIVDQLDAPITMHVHETQTEIQDCLAAHGRRPLAWLAEVGLLRPDFSAVHMNWLIEDDIDLAARTGLSVVHCPQSNQRLASGLSPVPELRGAGVNVALGTDGAASTGALDLLAECRAACLAASLRAQQPSALGALDVLEMATSGGAKALGLDADIGTLAAGKQADFLCIDLSGPACQPVFEPAATIVHAAQRADITDVYVAGRARVGDRQLLGFDEHELGAILRTWSPRLESGAAA